MSILDRRAFLRGSATTLAFSQVPGIAFAQTCVTSGLPPFTPNRLTVEGGARLQTCVVSAFKTWTFPAPTGGVDGNVTYSFVFE